MVCSAMLGSIFEDPCCATTAPCKATVVLKRCIPTGQTTEKHLSSRTGDTDSQMNSLIKGISASSYKVQSDASLGLPL